MEELRTRWARLHAEAAKHRGVVTYAMAAAFRIPRSTLREKARREGWTMLMPGAWALPGVQVTHHVLATAHLLLLGDRAVLGMRSAAFLHGLATAPPAPELLLPDDRRGMGRGRGVVRRTRTLRTADITTVHDLPVTRVARTARDLAGSMTWDEVYDLVTEAEQRRMVDLEELVGVADRLRVGPGGGRFASVVDTRRQDRSDSALERDTRIGLRGAGFEPSDGPFPIRVAGGKRLWLDVAIPHVWFALECDGVGFHSSRQAFERDRDRWPLIRRSGWDLTWVTRRRLRDDLDGILEEVAEAHRTFDPSRAPAVPAA